MTSKAGKPLAVKVQGDAVMAAGPEAWLEVDSPTAPRWQSGWLRNQ